MSNSYIQDHPTVLDLIISVSLMFPVITAAVFFRIWVNYRIEAYIRRSVKISDGFIFVAWLTLVMGYASCIWKAVVIIQHRNSVYIPISLRVTASKVIAAETLLYYTSLWLVKAAFISMYFGVASKLSKRLKYTLYMITVVVFLAYLVIILTSIFSCWPFSQNWYISETSLVGACQMINVKTFIHTTVLNISTDLLVMIMPLLILRLYTLRRRDIYGVAFLLALGSISITAAVVRAVNIIAMNLRTQNGYVNTRRVEIISFAELSAVFLAACAPSLRALAYSKRRGEMTRCMSGEERETSAFELDKAASVIKPTVRMYMPEGGSKILAGQAESRADSKGESMVSVWERERESVWNRVWDRV